jgi:hypothetical protein
MDTSDVARGTRDTIKHLDTVNRAASRSNADAAKGSTKALSGILRMVETGKVSAKGLDKIGKSASGLLGGLSSIGVGLGLGALPALSDLAVFAIGRIRESLIPLSKRVSDVAAALDDLNAKQLAFTDAQLGVVDADKALADSLDAFSKAQADAAAASAEHAAALKGRVVDTDKVSKAELRYHSAIRAVAAAQITQNTATRAVAKAIKDHGSGSNEAANAEDRLAKAGLRVKDAQEKEKAALRDLRKEKHGHKATTEELAKSTAKENEAIQKEKDAAIAAAHAQVGVQKAADGVRKAHAAVTASTATFNDKLKSLTATAMAHNRHMTYAASGAKVMSTNTKKAADDVAAGLRTWAASQNDLNPAVAEGARRAADLIEKTHKIPKNLSTVFAAPGLAEANKATDLYQQLLDDIRNGGPVKTPVTAPGLNAVFGMAINLGHAFDNLQGRVVSTTIVTNQVIHQHTTGVPASGARVAGRGIRVAGRFDAADDVPIMVSRGEVILNPRQQMLVDAGMTIDGALAATGAPTIRAGAGHAGGGWPHRKHKEKAADFHSRVVDYASGLEQRTEDHWDTLLQDYDAATAREQQIASRGGGTYSPARLAVRDRGALSIIDREITRLRALKRVFHKHKVSTHDIDRKLHDLAQTRLDRQTDLGDAQYDVAHPAAADAAGGGGAAGPDPFTVQRATDAGFAAGLGRAVGYVFGGSGDIGSGGANALGAAGSVGTLHVANVVIKNTPANTTQLAAAGNTGNALVNRGRVYTPRVGAAFGR